MDPTTATTGLLHALGARIPAIAAPMAGGPSATGLVAAAADAGALGFIAGGYQTPEALKAQIETVRRHTDRFGVNLFTPNPVPVDPARYAAYAEQLRPVAEIYGLTVTTDIVEDDDHWGAKVDVLVDAAVPVVSFTFGLPAPDVVARLHAVGSHLVQTVTSADEAALAARRGVDGLVLQCWRAGGHSGTLTPSESIEQVELPDLIRSVRDVTTLPIWAAGGIASSADAAAALDAGAEAVIVGTLLLRATESGANATHQQALADAADDATTQLTTAFSGRPARALRNAFVDRFSSDAPLGYPALHHLTSPIRKAAIAAGAPEDVNLWAGTGYRSATDEPVATILRRLVAPGDQLGH